VKKNKRRLFLKEMSLNVIQPEVFFANMWKLFQCENIERENVVLRLWFRQKCVCFISLFARSI